MPRRDRVEHFGVGVERADSSGGAHFVTGEGVEVAAKLLHVDRHVAGALRTIDERQRANGMRFFAKLAHRIDRAE